MCVRTGLVAVVLISAESIYVGVPVHTDYCDDLWSNLMSSITTSQSFGRKENWEYFDV